MEKFHIYALLLTEKSEKVSSSHKVKEHVTENFDVQWNTTLRNPTKSHLKNIQNSS